MGGLIGAVVDMIRDSTRYMSDFNELIQYHKLGAKNSFWSTPFMLGHNNFLVVIQCGLGDNIKQVQ